MSERYSNKRMLHRQGGRFYEPTAADFGIGGFCKIHHRMLLRVYDGDLSAQAGPTTGTPDPRLFRYRCFECEPETDAEKQVREAKEAAEPKFSRATFMERGTK